MSLTNVPLDAQGWSWPRHKVERAMFLGRDCIRFADTANFVAAPHRVGVRDGTIELDLAISAARSFHGLVWRRVARTRSYESFFVRPHQVGNPDAVQYTPVFNDVSGWQLYHGPGHWAPVSFPIGRWFRMRVAFAGDRGEAYLDDMTRPALVFARLKAPVAIGGIGILVGGPGLHVARFAYDATKPLLRGRTPRRPRTRPSTIESWWVSEPVAEGSPLAAAQGWSHLESEPSGLANLARLHALRGRRNTVFARTTIHATAAGTCALELGFSDRAVVYLNGRPLFAGDDTYRSRDCRFLGSIGYWYTVQLPLAAGDNELVMAISESFGGWGLMARLAG